MSVPLTKDPALADHLAWLGYIQPEGLVVSAPALVDAQVVIDRAGLSDLQRRFVPHVSSLALTDSDTGDTAAGIADIPRFLIDYLGWPADFLVGWDATRPLPPELTAPLPEFGETLTPTYAVTQPKASTSPWLLLVKTHPATTDLDKPASSHERGWPASPAKKFERLLRETQVPIGLLTNGVSFRLIYAPPKENSGALTFPVAAMTEISGRLILGAFHLLLNSLTLFNAPSEARLPAILQRSRDYQASVSEKLAEQVLHALYELLRGFEAADSQAKGKLLRDLAAKHPEDIYGGLVTVLLRLVFVLFAEDRGLLPMGGLYVNHYSVRGLFERLRADAERHPDTMDLRYGAWAQLLALFRLIHGGCRHPELTMPAREGHLFDPQRFPFLEGRTHRDHPVSALPLVSDGVLHRILENLCILDGERVSYRTLDVEEIGSVYQTIMGFGVEVVAGTAVAMKGKRKKGSVPASPIVDLEALLAQKPADRLKHLAEQADTKLTGEAEKRVKDASSVDDLLAALEKRIDRYATPSPVAKDGLALQPNDERRRSGSHYTPRSFTEPIVRKTLEPVLARLVGPDLSTVPSDQSPTPAQILELKVADIAVGSAAFLVEACRQLGDALVRAWRLYGGRPPVPLDETEELLAMRLIAQRCLYGVDRNPMAVDLAKLSLWLATLAKDHPFTFLDHNIRCGDSLVGLTQKQIEAFTWEEKTAGKQRILGQDFLEKRIKAATSYRREILEGGDYVLPALKAAKLKLADEALDEVRFAGDLIVSAFFAGDKDKVRYQRLEDLRERYVACHASKTFDPALKPREAVQQLRSGDKAVWPFHWGIEFPEVFDKRREGFDAVVGNPPFLGGTSISTSNTKNYLNWITVSFPESGDRMDLVAYFFRRAYALINQHGTYGLISTNTIAQGDTRKGGLRHICSNGGIIYSATRRVKWPGVAAVVVSVIHVAKGGFLGPRILDGRAVELITAFLFHTGINDDPSALSANAQIAFNGIYILGMGFTFDDGNPDATSLDEMRRLIASNPSNAQRIDPYIGGEELNDDPKHEPSRYVITFTGVADDDIVKWPELLRILELKVKPERLQKADDVAAYPWWRFWRDRPELLKATKLRTRIAACARHQPNWSIAFIPKQVVPSDALVVFAIDKDSEFAVVQSRTHEIWARFFGSSIKDDLRYTPSDCFETFPFPEKDRNGETVEIAGRLYYEFRAATMVSNDEGLTEIYNRFHDPEEIAPDILKLRELHTAMDRAVLDAYGWVDIPTDCEFLLDYEDDDEVEGKARKRKKPWRYRWPDEVRDEVLARLLKLNAERAEQERLTGEAASPAKPTKRSTSAKPSRKPKSDTAGVTPAQPDLLPPAQGDLFV
jgi:hypothetical protein